MLDLRAVHCCRKLFITRAFASESYAAASLEMKSLVEQTEEAPVRKLAAAERAEMFREQQDRLMCLKFQGQQEPGESLVDLAVGIYQGDRLRHIPWDQYVSREHEILTSTKMDPLLSFDSSGIAKNCSGQLRTACQVLFGTQGVWNLLSYTKHDAWCELLFHRRMTEPPPGYNKVSFKQLQMADAKLFVVLGEATRSGIKVNAVEYPSNPRHLGNCCFTLQGLLDEVGEWGFISTTWDVT